MAQPVPRLPRPSIAPASGMTSAAGPSRMRRLSVASHMSEVAPYPNAGKRRESGFGIVRGRYNTNKQITDQDIDDKVMLQVLVEGAQYDQCRIIFFRYRRQ